MASKSSNFLVKQYYPCLKHGEISLSKNVSRTLGAKGELLCMEWNQKGILTMDKLMRRDWSLGK